MVEAAVKHSLKSTILFSLFLAALSPLAVFADPAATLAKADAVYEKALALGHGWSVTQPLIDEAHAALAGGDQLKAQALADRALLTAEQSLEQAEREQTAWRSRVPDN